MRSFSRFAVGEVVLLHRPEQLRLQVGDHAAGAGQEPVAAEHQRGEQPGRVGGEHVHRPRQALQRADVHLVLRHVAGPVLDGADRGHLLDHLQERVARIALAGRQRILEGDDRQVGGVGDAPEVGERHLRRLLQRERGRREDQQRRGAAVSSHTGDARGFERAVGPDAVDDGQPGADLVLGDRQHRRCSSKVQEATSVECALMVMAEIPSVAPRRAGGCGSSPRRWRGRRGTAAAPPG